MAYEILKYNSIKTDGYNANGDALDYKGYEPTYKELNYYDHLIEPGDGSYNLTGKGFDQTLKTLPEVVKKYNYQVKKLANHLYSSDYKQACFNIWHFLTKNIKYKFDTVGYEEMRSPARSWREKNIGIDCDCFSIFSACLLIRMGYYPHFQIVAFNNKPDYGHIYVILQNTILDCVMKKFDQEPDNVTKKLNLMITNVVLNGPETSGIKANLENELNRLKQIVNSGNATANDFKEIRKIKFLLVCLDHEAREQLLELMHYIDDINADQSFVFKNKTINAIINGVNAVGINALNDDDIENNAIGNIDASEDDIQEMEDIAGILGEIDEIDQTPIDGLGKLKIFNRPKAVQRKQNRVAKKAARKAAPKSKLKKLVKKLAPKKVLQTVKKVAVKAAKLSPRYIVAKAVANKIKKIKSSPKRTQKRVPVITEERNQEETNQEETNQEETNQEETNQEETNQEDTNQEETNQEETNQEETNQEETNQEETNQEETNQEETNQEDSEMEGLGRMLKKQHSDIVDKIKSGSYTPADVKALKKTRLLMMAPSDERPHIAELMNYVDDIDHNGNYVFKNKTINALINGVDGLGNVSSSLGEIEVDEHDLGELESIEQIFDEMEDSINGNLQGLDKLFKTKAERQTKREAKKAAGKTIKQKLKKVAEKLKPKNVISKIKKVAKKIRKYNPAFAAARGSLLVLLNLNVFNMAYKLSVGYLTEAEATAKGYNISEWKKAVDAAKKTEKLFENAGGTISKLKKAIEKGKDRKEARVARRNKRKGITGIDYIDDFNLSGFFSLGIEPTTTVGTAAVASSAGLWGSILKWFKGIKWKNISSKIAEKLSKSPSEDDVLNDNDFVDSDGNVKTSGETPNTSGNNTGMILLVLGAGTLAFLAFK